MLEEPMAASAISDESVAAPEPGLPVPRRRTFASAIPAAAHCMSAALRHPASACSHSPALRATGNPSQKRWSGKQWIQPPSRAAIRRSS
jgi:hypothetical protein